VNFLSHQVINRATPSKYALLSISWGNSLSNHGGLTEASLPEGKGMEGNVERNGNVDLPTNSPGISIDPHMMARGLCERLQLSRQMGQGSVYMAVFDIAQIAAKQDGDLANLCDRMVEAYEKWMQQELEYRWGPAKFFGEGWWDKPETWPRKKEHLPTDKATRRDEKWKEFDAKENDNEID
jgi:hypothetical protein